MADGEALHEGQEVRSGPLYRRILPETSHFKRGQATQRNFVPDEHGEVSMFCAAETAPSTLLMDHDRFGLLLIDAEVLWGLGLRVIYTPQWGPGHVSVLGFTKSDAQPRRDAAFAARVLVPPMLPS